ncbi:MAG: tripartite tricarboxylate transporter TctB family protein [Burkholderiales bacterium]|nr:tripartite tricarboxylate transporter TctB family protein [Burkholderiales bacterium]
MRSRRSRQETAFAFAVVALGVGLAIGTALLPSEGGYSGIGPSFMPAMVSAGTIIVGAWLAFEALTGGWRNRSPEDPAARGEHAFLPAAFAWVSAGLLAQMALIGLAGFVLSSALLFACVARGFGSRRALRDAAIGLALALVVYFFFTRALSVNLPAGRLFGG